MQFRSLTSLLIAGAAVIYPALSSPLAALPDVKTPIYVNASSPQNGGLFGKWNKVALVGANFTVPKAKVPAHGSSKIVYSAHEFVAAHCENIGSYLLGLNISVVNGKASYNTFYGTIDEHLNPHFNPSSVPVAAGDKISLSVMQQKANSPWIVMFENLTKKTQYTKRVGNPCPGVYAEWLLSKAPRNLTALPDMDPWTIQKLGFKGAKGSGYETGDLVLIQGLNPKNQPAVDCQFAGQSLTCKVVR